MSIEEDHLSTGSFASKIPAPLSPFRRASSMRVRGEKLNLSSSLPTQSVIYEGLHCPSQRCIRTNLIPTQLGKSRVSSFSKNCLDDDLESVGSFTSNFSSATANSSCEHVNFAKNGTTYSGRTHKYIVHCSSDLKGNEEYLTPTQRANRNIKKLKSLLQLAKEKLREKEEEILKLNLEVNELKLHKQSVAESIKINCCPPKSSSEDSSFDSIQHVPQNLENFLNERESELSPIKCVPEDIINCKVSPTLSQDGVGEKSSITSDFLVSSLADSGNFDDLPSYASVFSKDSSTFITSELKTMQEELNTYNNGLNDSESQALNSCEKKKLIQMYEKKLNNKKLEYELELSKVIKDQEQRNLKIIHDFEEKLKDEEMKFETRWNELLKATEEEKILIVNRFETKLEEEKKKYKENLLNYKSQGGKLTDTVFNEVYCKAVDEEKTIYETALVETKQKFEAEKIMIEKKFDDAILTERIKFENNLKSIREICDLEVNDLKNKVSDLEAQYSELLPKYEIAMTKKEELEKENEFLRDSLKQQEESHKKLFFEIFKKGQEAANLKFKDEESEASDKQLTKVSVPELFAQLKITEVELENLKDKEYRALHSDNQGFCLLSSKEAISLWLLAARKAMYQRLAEARPKAVKKENNGSDPEATLQFLKSAVYYFLTDKENHLGHLKAIESILAFSSAEKSNIERLYLNRY